MKRDIIISEVELSYEELKGLETHSQQLQSDAVARIFKQTPAVTINLLGKILSKFRSAEQLKSLNAEP